MKFAVIIPALNEEGSIEHVLKAIPSAFREHIVVADNGSTDRTAELAQELGATVVVEKKRGYGAACLAGIEQAKKWKPDIYVFLDADFSDDPTDMKKIVDELLSKKLDLVIGSRMQAPQARAALLPQARFGNWFATALMRLRYGGPFTDLGPFRAITRQALETVQMQDQNFGWTMEMQVKALRLGLRVGEVPVHYKKRIGVSKITGTISGTFQAGWKILWTLFKYSSRF